MRRLSFVFAFFLLFAIASSAQSKPTETVVDFNSADGTKLKGTYFSAGKPGPGVLLLHQCNQQRKIWDSLARQLSAAGLNVFTFDLRNFGESEGKPAAQLSQQENQAAVQKWPEDVDAGFNYLVSQPGVKRDVVGVGGASCGVNNSVQAARRHPEVKSLVLLAGNTGLAGREFLRKAATLPVLFGYADDDQYPATIRTTQWLYALDPNPGKRLVTYATGKHGAEIFSVHPEFEKIITDWYVTTLIKTPGRAPATKSVTVPKEVAVLNLIDEPGGAAKVAEMLTSARKSDPKATLFPEDVVNIIGYEHMQAGDIKTAVAILKLNAEAYPDSANVYDSLSDAYLADGQKQLALENAKKALEMLPNDKNLNDQLRDAIRQSCEQKLMELGGSGGTADEQAVWNLENAYWKYVQAFDLDGYRTLWHSDFLGWPYMSPQPLGKANITGWIADYQKKGLHLDSFSIEPSGTKTNSTGVVVFYLVTTKWVDKDGKGEPNRSRITHTWVKSGTSWQIISGMSAAVSK